MQESSIKKKSLKGSIWSLIDNICSQGFAFLIGIVLARLLTPTDYGTVGVLAIFIAIANVFVDCGFANALIRKKDRNQEDLSTAFCFNIVVGIIVYGALFFMAPLVAMFFKMQILVPLLRVLALCIVFNSLSLVQNTILTANLSIQKQAIINICTQIPMGCIGIYFAYEGFGVWTLVIQQVGSSFLKFLWLWISSTWRPILQFSKESFKYLYDFGWKLLGANLFGTIFNEIYGFVIGRILGASDLGYYAKSKQLSGYPSTLISNIVNRVVLPIMVEVQGDTNKIREFYRRLISILSFLTFPIFGLLVMIAEPLILEMWTAKWSSTILLFQILCVGMAFGPFSTLNFCLLQLLNRTDITLKLEFVKKPICLILLLVSIPFGLRGIVLFSTVYNIYACLINMYPTYKLLSYSYMSQLSDITASFLLTTVTMAISYYPMTLIENNWLRIFASVVIFGVIYFGLNVIFNKLVIKDIRNLVLKR